MPHAPEAETISKQKPKTKSVSASSKTKTRKKPQGTSNEQKDSGALNISHQERLQMVSEAAYYRAEKRGFDPQGQWQDWYEAEQQVEEIISKLK